jgi:hypothetical protein
MTTVHNSNSRKRRAPARTGASGKYHAMSLINERTSAHNKISDDSAPRPACWQHRRRTP